MVEVGTLLFPSHEATSHGFIPSALRFVKDDYSIAWCLCTLQSCISEVVNILDKGLHLLTNLALAHFFLNSLEALDFIAGQRFSENGNERTVSGKEDGVRLLMPITLLGGDIQPNKRFSSTGHSRYKDDMLFSLRGRLFD